MKQLVGVSFSDHWCLVDSDIFVNVKFCSIVVFCTIYAVSLNKLRYLQKVMQSLLTVQITSLYGQNGQA